MVMALFGVPSPAGSTVTCGNILYLLLFGWWLSLLYVLVAAGMFVTVVGVPYGEPQVGEAFHRKGWGSNGSSGWIEKPNLWVLHGPHGWGGTFVVSNRAELCVPTGRLCWNLAGYFLWPFGKVIQNVEVTVLPKSDGGGDEGAPNWTLTIPISSSPPNPDRHQVCMRPTRRAQRCLVALHPIAGTHGVGWMKDIG